MSRAGGGSKNNSLQRPKEEINIKYMHRPPLITPNYGNQKRSVLPKSKVSRVLLYDNATQDHMLDIKLAHINIEKERISRILNLHKKSFSARMQKKALRMQTVSNSGSKQNNTGSAQDYAVTPIRPFAEDREMSSPQNKDAQIDNVSPSDADENNVNIGDLKFPNIENDKRHVIFKVKDKDGKMAVYHTVDEHGVLSDIIPPHSFYSKLIDDPRFKSLQNSLVPMEKFDTWPTTPFERRECRSKV